jgi:hypothetical protein
MEQNLRCCACLYSTIDEKGNPICGKRKRKSKNCQDFVFPDHHKYTLHKEGYCLIICEVNYYNEEKGEPYYRAWLSAYPDPYRPSSKRKPAFSAHTQFYRSAQSEEELTKGAWAIFESNYLANLPQA